MDLSSALYPQCCRLLTANDAEEALRELAEVASQAGFLDNVDNVVQTLILRDKERPSHFCREFCFPRAAIKGVRKPLLAIGVLKRPIPWVSGGEISTIIMFVTPWPKNVEFLKALVSIAQSVKEPQMRDLLKSAKNPADLYNKAKKVFG